MKQLHYKITFYSYWHCGSGQAAGADVDELVVKDRSGFPYVPGRTIKGLLRDAADTLSRYNRLDGTLVRKTFGYFDNKEDVEEGSAFFSDATLSAAFREKITPEQKAALYKSLAFTAISYDKKDEGIAKDKSLRKLQVAVPCQVHGVILNVPDEMEKSMAAAMKLVKRLGVGRNHGLGRCKMEKED
jgi:CRISPR/Cas system CSM-associated protein Csm3 (group 7 of RAMP superfamily)